MPAGLRTLLLAIQVLQSLPSMGKAAAVCHGRQRRGKLPSSSPDQCWQAVYKGIWGLQVLPTPCTWPCALTPSELVEWWGYSRRHHSSGTLPLFDTQRSREKKGKKRARLFKEEKIGSYCCLLDPRHGQEKTQIRKGPTVA